MAPPPHTKATTTTSNSGGGIKGLLQRTGRLVHRTGTWILETGTNVAVLTYKWGGQAAFVVATSSVLVLMPLLFEIAREGEMLEMEKLQANDFRTKGYSDRQLKEMGFSDAVLHTPSVATMGSSSSSSSK
ncbi:hypothetical protein ACA910_005582 [Epithemia clementina (nom. ined.)]